MELRYFIDRWWHGAALDVALEQLGHAFQALGLAPADLPAPLIAQRTRDLADQGADEEVVRQHQIGIAAVAANLALAAGGAAHRVRALGPGARPETDEPAWVVVASPADLAPLHQAYGAPEGLEAAYDAAPAPDAVSAAAPAPLAPQPYLAVLEAQRAFAERRYAEALALADLGAQDASHGVLAELVRIQALVALSRKPAARLAWEATARAWLTGERRAFDTQWAALARLHARVARPDDDLTAQVRARVAR